MTKWSHRVRPAAAFGLAMVIVLSILDDLDVYTAEDPLWRPLAIVGLVGLVVMVILLVRDGLRDDSEAGSG